MKLYKALKLKKKLAGEIAKLKQQINSRNSYEVGSKNAEKYDVNKLEDELKKKTEELIDLKFAIYKANEPIQRNIYDLAETKGLIQMWEITSVREGRMMSEYSSVDREYAVFVDEKARDHKVVELQNKVDSIQELIDTFNYTTEI